MLTKKEYRWNAEVIVRSLEKKDFIQIGWFDEYRKHDPVYADMLERQAQEQLTYLKSRLEKK